MKDLSKWLFILNQNPWWTWAVYLGVVIFFGLILFRLWVYVDLQWQILRHWRRPNKLQDKKILERYRFLSLLVASLCGGLGFVVAAWPGLGLGFLLGLALVWVFVWQQKRQQAQQLKQQLPLFFRALGSTLKAGYSVPQALSFVVDEVDSPLKDCLQRGKKALEWQQPLPVVLADWRQNLAVPEFDFLADSLTLQSRTGGNLVDLCHNVAQLLEERLKLERDLKSFTAQGKMSGLLMAGLWPVSLALFSWLSPSHTNVLFHTSAGQILLVFSLLLELIGFWFIWRLVRVTV